VGEEENGGGEAVKDGLYRVTASYKNGPPECYSEFELRGGSVHAKDVADGLCKQWPASREWLQYAENEMRLGRFVHIEEYSKFMEDKFVGYRAMILGIEDMVEGVKFELAWKQGQEMALKDMRKGGRIT
jgi:hypothetical protein